MRVSGFRYRDKVEEDFNPLGLLGLLGPFEPQSLAICAAVGPPSSPLRVPFGFIPSRSVVAKLEED